MASLRGRFRLLWGVVLLLLAVGCSGSSSSHSLRYFITAVSEPGPGLPQFICAGYVDDQPIRRYDSITRRMVPQVPWMEEAGKEDPQYWERDTQKAQGAEASFRWGLVTLQDHYNQSSSTGLHTLQLMYGCKVGPDGRLSQGNVEFAYDGEDFMSLDKQTLTWMARMPQPLPTKRWESQVPNAQRWKAYLEEICVEWLQKYLDYGKEMLQRKESPTGRVVRKKGYDGQETLDCQLYGFYPKDIDVTWMKDEEDRKPETLTVGIIPNSDGTYHTSLRIDIDSKDRDHYRCRVEHDSLPKPLDLAWEEPASNVGLIVGIVVGVLVAILLVSGVVWGHPGSSGVAFFIKRRRAEHHYKATPGSDQGSDSFTKGTVPEA